MNKRFYLVIFFISAVLFLIYAGTQASTLERGIKEKDVEEITYIPGEILVQWKDWADAPAIKLTHEREGAKVVETFYATPKKERVIQRVRIKEGQNVEEAIQKYSRKPMVEYAQPNYIYRIQNIPNDPRFGELWGLHNTGQPVGDVMGISDADIDAPEAWTINTGSQNVIIAVQDTGVNYNHHDLAGNMWINPAEVPNNGIDDDGNGFIDDIYGWDFFDNDNSPMDFHGHGTHVAGTIGAVGNNAIGITGVMWNVQIMAIKIFGVEAPASTSEIIQSINYAAANGAHIINASWGGPGGTDGDLLYNAIMDFGGLFVAAAGNAGANNDLVPSFPANYNLPNIISVAATNQHDVLAGFSNFGTTRVHVAAPGVNILSTIPILSEGSPVTIYDSIGFEGAAPGTVPSGWVRIANQSGIANTWQVTTARSAAGTRSLVDSPEANYVDNLISTETLTYLNIPITHTNDSRYQIICDIRYNLEYGFDYFDVLLSIDRIEWYIIDWFTGSSGGHFVPWFSDLTGAVEFFGATGVYSGFGIWSDESFTFEGVYIDNLRLVRMPIHITGHGYISWQGTSMAAPHVAGLAGLLLSQNPNLTASQLRALIIAGVDDLGLPVSSGGRINAYNSLMLTPPPVVLETNFAQSSDINLYAYEDVVGKTGQPTVGWISNYLNASGVASFSFGNYTQGVKMTLNLDDFISSVSSKWYLLEARVMTDSPAINDKSVNLFLFNGIPLNPFDVAAHAIPHNLSTTWSWMRIYLQSIGGLEQMYPQLIIQNNGHAGNIYIDTIRITQQAPPTMPTVFYAGGDWDNSDDINYWAIEEGFDVTSMPSYNVSDGELGIIFDGLNLQGLKMTMSTTAGLTVTAPTNIGKIAPTNIGLAGGMSIQIDGTGSLSDALIFIAAFGTNQPGGGTIEEIAASASYQRIPPGENGLYRVTYYPTQPYIYGQIMVKNSTAGTFYLDNTYLMVEPNIVLVNKADYWELVRK